MGFVLVFIPVVLFGMDCAITYLRDCGPQPQNSKSHVQVWLLDLVSAMLASSVGLGIRPYVTYSSPFFDSARREDKNIILLILFLFTCATAILASLDILRNWSFGKQTKARPVIFAIVFAIFIYIPWVAMLLWCAEHKIVSLRRNGGRANDTRHKRLAAFALIPYAIAFILPMQMFKYDFMGFSAYSAAFSELLEHGGDPLGWLWLANPLFWIGIAFLLEGDFGLAAMAGLIAFLFSLTYMAGGERIEFLPAYHIWAGSMLVLVVAALVAKTKWREPAALAEQKARASVNQLQDTTPTAQ